MEDRPKPVHKAGIGRFVPYKQSQKPEPWKEPTKAYRFFQAVQPVVKQLTLLFSFAFSIYQLVIGTLLTIFVEQKCGLEPCSIYQTVSELYSYDYFAFAFNFLTLFVCTILMILQFIRERYFVTQLEHNYNLSHSSSIEQSIEYWTKHVQEYTGTDLNGKLILPTVHKYNVYLYKTTWIAICFYTCNVIFSAVKLIRPAWFNGYRTMTGLITNTAIFSLQLLHSYRVADQCKESIGVTAVSLYKNEPVCYSQPCEKQLKKLFILNSYVKHKDSAVISIEPLKEQLMELTSETQQ
jgi:hypothetical protein